MNRCSFCEWIPILPWPVWPLAGQSLLGQNVVVGSMMVLLALCGSMPRGVYLGPHFRYKCASPRLSAELPRPDGHGFSPLSLPGNGETVSHIAPVSQDDSVDLSACEISEQPSLSPASLALPPVADPTTSPGPRYQGTLAWRSLLQGAAAQPQW